MIKRNLFEIKIRGFYYLLIFQIIQMQNPVKKAKPAQKNTQKVFEIDGQKFKFKHKKYTGLVGKEWTEEEALKNPVELERLVMEKCNVIEKVQTPKKTK